jgi:hypothetical protein
MGKIDQVLILGAGFSNHAGPPLQSRFTEYLLKARYFQPGTSKALIAYLSDFVHDTFDRGRKAAPDIWPELEDIFTSIDLSANHGHHLGALWPPSKLRTVRRALIVRTVRMLGRAYETAPKDKNWRRLERFLKCLNLQGTAFINLSWDTVLEQRLSEIFPNSIAYTYGSHVHRGSFPKQGNVVRTGGHHDLNSQMTVTIIKVHGSINWLYCDNCRRTFWFPPAEYKQIADQLLGDVEWKDIDAALGKKTTRWTCAWCNEVPLGTRLATFSYRKSLDFPLFQKSWFLTEQFLRETDAWIFIGYSLPPADFEFKYLLKRVQVSRRTPPRLFVITGGDEASVERTKANYEKFFGRGIYGKAMFEHGIDSKAIAGLRGQIPNLILGS